MSSDPINSYVGKRIRQRRKEMGASQQMLGEALGCSFQQIHKYESGENLIPASVLYSIAWQQGCDPAWYFEGCEVLEDAEASCSAA